ncbi:hypothetical protein E0Z10_g6038 [Xylaria hypoxylon]|uniref:Stc1 domain-containing protein n=1 Tax=Xylaria hypoxylon TaxID=37992 RepID=A0A4Z0YUA6_9PEZI|nr:hypothetical protein E0Z10_g6038 [Xylaria hypoxylon]
MLAMVQRANKLSRSTDSVTSQPLSQDAGYDALFLPMNDHVYLTQTKDGKPALGRKKSGKLLRDFGFDILGQSFGVPSRKDYERQARPLSAASQSSGLITTPVTPRPRQAYTYEDAESSVVCGRTNSRRSSSTTLPIEIARYNGPGTSSSHQDTAYKINPPFRKPAVFNQHHIPPPPPPPPPSVVGWHNYPAANTGVAPIQMSYYDTAYQPTHLPGYSYNSPARFQGPPNWANPQHHMTAQYPDHLGISMPQTTAIPILPHHQQARQPQPAWIPHTQAIPSIHSANIPPPPPPPPPQDWLRAHAMATGQGETTRQYAKQASNAKRATGQANQTGDPIREARQMHEKPNNNEDVKRRLSKRIRHVHVCAGCGKKRSARYQKAHPLERGEIPALNYCYGCLKDAADTDCYTSDEDAGGGPPIRKQTRKKASVPWPSSDEGHTIANGNYTYEQSRHGPRWVKKSNRFGSLARLFSRRVASYPSSPRSKPAPSTERSSSRASSPIRRNEGRAGSRAIREAEALALPRTREKESDKAKNEGKVRTTSNTKLAFARPRTRIPRPRAQLELIGVKLPPSADANDSARVFRSSPCLDADGDTEVAPILQPAEMEPCSNTPSQYIPNETGRTVKQANTRGYAHGRAKKGRLSFLETANHIDAPNDASGLDLQESMKESSRIPVDADSEGVLKEVSGKPTNYSDSRLSSGNFRIPSNHSPQINPEQTETLHHPPISNNSGQPPPSGNTRKVVGDPKAAFSWDEPLTPTDVPYAGSSPCVVSDSWSDYQTDMEREVEEMAERDLAFAVSYNSDSDHIDDDAATPSITEADAEKGVEGNTPTKQIEFSSEQEQQQKFANSKSHTEPSIAHLEHSSSCMAELSDRQQNNLYNEPRSGQDDDNDVYYSPSPVGSSIIGHTGHSTDNLIQNTPARLTDGNRLRRFMRLSST